MKFTLVTLVVIGLSLGNNIALGATNKCKYVRMADLSIARDANGKKRKNVYVDDFTKELIYVTELADISHPMRPGGREMTGWVFGRSQGDVGVSEAEHDKMLFLKIEHFWEKKTFPTDDDVQNSISVPAGGELLIGMADGSIVTLYANSAKTAETTYKTPKPHSGRSFWLTSIATIGYKLDANALAALKNTEARAVRLKTATGNLDVRIHNGGTDNIQNVVKCISGDTK